MMIPILCANWKMSLSLEESKALFSRLGLALRHRILSKTPLRLWVAPPLVFLSDLQTLFKTHFSDLEPFLALMAQDISPHEKGAYTGEISASQAKEVGASCVLIGHSERRLYHGETLPLMGYKCIQALNAGLTPVVCLGEDQEDTDQSVSISKVLHELSTLLLFLKEHGHFLENKKSSKIPFVGAYEPRWAIGTHKIPTSNSIEHMMAALCNTLADLAPHVSIPLIYGGSVNEANSSLIMSLPHVSGLLVGGASLQAASMESLMETFPTTS